MKPAFFALLLLLAGCTTSGTQDMRRTKQPLTAAPVESDNRIPLHKLEKLFCVGDFDGDGVADTLFQHNYSRLISHEIDRAADPFQNEWDTVVNWFYRQEPDVYLTINKANQDTLHLGEGQGLYCLINIGDNNADGKEEIALVKDNLDLSRVNTCTIFALCKNKWTLSMEFAIHEGAFDFTGDASPVFTDIKGFLEKHRGKWVYMDYHQNGYDTEEEVGKMKQLKLQRCK